MKITIVGWYGTETIGDRAILAGILSILKDVFNNFDLNLGSLYPFFSERTINEDYTFYKSFLKGDINISIFDSKNLKDLDKAIRNSDIVIMGGGPIMHIDPIYMIEYAFKKAKKNGKVTMVMGCGIGPLFTKNHKKSLVNIINNSDLIILRDNKSRDNLNSIFREFNINLNKQIYTSFDPSVRCIIDYLATCSHNVVMENYIALNLREFPKEYSKNSNSLQINEKLVSFVRDLSERFKEYEIRMIPMHYFHIGSDDRYFLNNIKMELRVENLIVQNTNLSLVQTLKCFQHACFNIGMRFHSVVLQTLVSGRNYILDYTEPNKGKIAGFIEDIDRNDFYKKRYISLQQSKDIKLEDFSLELYNNRFEIDLDYIKTRLNVYYGEISNLCR